MRYLPAGLYAGAEVEAAMYTFWAKDDRTTIVPDPRAIVSGTAFLGIWREEGEVRADGGAFVEDGQWVPAARMYARWAPKWTVAPRVEVRAGAMEGASAVTKTRLGGLTPYSVPLAGAAWGEWWVEDYVAGRAGATAGTAHLRGGLLVDAAAWAGAEGGDAGTAVGFAVTGEARWRRMYAEIAGGYAPWVPRQEGISRVSVFFRVGLDWSPLRPKSARDG